MAKEPKVSKTAAEPAPVEKKTRKVKESTKVEESPQIEEPVPQKKERKSKTITATPEPQQIEEPIMVEEKKSKREKKTKSVEVEETVTPPTEKKSKKSTITTPPVAVQEPVVPAVVEESSKKSKKDKKETVVVEEKVEKKTEKVEKLVKKSTKDAEKVENAPEKVEKKRPNHVPRDDSVDFEVKPTDPAWMTVDIKRLTRTRTMNFLVRWIQDSILTAAVEAPSSAEKEQNKNKKNKKTSLHMLPFPHINYQLPDIKIQPPNGLSPGLKQEFENIMNVNKWNEIVRFFQIWSNNPIRIPLDFSSPVSNPNDPSAKFMFTHEQAKSAANTFNIIQQQKKAKAKSFAKVAEWTDKKRQLKKDGAWTGTKPETATTPKKVVTAAVTEPVTTMTDDITPIQEEEKKSKKDKKDKKDKKEDKEEETQENTTIDDNTTNKKKRKSMVPTTVEETKVVEEPIVPIKKKSKNNKAEVQLEDKIVEEPKIIKKKSKDAQVEVQLEEPALVKKSKRSKQ